MKFHDRLKILSKTILENVKDDNLPDEAYFRRHYSNKLNQKIFLPLIILHEFVQSIVLIRNYAKINGVYLSDKKIENMLIDYYINLKYIVTDNLNNEIDKNIKSLFFNIKNLDTERFLILIPIVNMIFDNVELKIGNTTLLNLSKEKYAKIESKFGFAPYYESVNDVFDKVKNTNETETFALVIVDAGDRNKAIELAMEKVELNLNVIRLFFSEHRPRIHGNMLQKGKREILMRDISSKSFSHSVEAIGPFITSFYFGKEELKYLNGNGLKLINNILKKEDKLLSNLEKSILAAIYWFGNSIIDVNRVSKFLKYMISLESLLLTGESSKKELISKRLSSIIYQNSGYKKESYIIMKKLYKQRNDIIHAGKDYVEIEDVKYIEGWARAAIINVLNNHEKYQNIIDLINADYQINEAVYR